MIFKPKKMLIFNFSDCWNLFFYFTFDPLVSNLYIISFFFLIISIVLVGFLLLVPYSLTGRMLKAEDSSSEYECGFEPFDSATRQPFTVEFYIIGILFLIFDVEITLVLPWSLIFSVLPYQGILIMLFFLVLLALGFLYEANLGILNWGVPKKPQKP